MYLGIDIGTTSISIVLLNQNKEMCESITLKNDFHIITNNNSRIQNAEKIVNSCLEIVKCLDKKYNIDSIGISNQMHGILYIDNEGKAVSPLYTWQDERGNELYKEEVSYSSKLSEISGYNVSTGYGSTSFFYDSVNDLVPEKAVSIATIGDYLALVLTNEKRVLMNETNAAAIGLYDIKRHNWDYEAIKKAGLTSSFYPNVSSKISVIGKYLDRINVYTAIGDNQASVYGTTKDDKGIVVNYGTGSQITFIVDKYIQPPLGCELRPYFDDKYLLIGGALCGGYAYQLLRNFYSSVCGEMFDYEKMNKWALEYTPKNAPIVETKFKGERHNPTKKASILNLSEENFTPQAITYSFLKGMCQELKDFYEQISPVVGEKNYLIGTGNGIRKNIAFQKIIQNSYQMDLFIPKHMEEAAFGAAILAAEEFLSVSLKDFILYN